MEGEDEVNGFPHPQVTHEDWWTKKYCILWKKHRGQHKSHNMHDLPSFNKKGPIKKNGGESKPHLKEKASEGANFT